MTVGHDNHVLVTRRFFGNGPNIWVATKSSGPTDGNS